jgi:hypothetical protein
MATERGILDKAKTALEAGGLWFRDGPMSRKAANMLASFDRIRLRYLTHLEASRALLALAAAARGAPFSRG